MTTGASCGVEDGTVVACGENDLGQLGIAIHRKRATVHSTFPFDPVAQVACGDNHTFFRSGDGTIAACGVNGRGQLGLGFSDHLVRRQPVPIPVWAPIAPSSLRWQVHLLALRGRNDGGLWRRNLRAVGAGRRRGS